MPIHKTINQDFFKEWSPTMAYILGFFAADGNMVKNKRGAHFISIEITDKELLEKIRAELGSNHKIGVRENKINQKPTYRLQVGSKNIFQDLLRLGLRPNKSQRLKLPRIPEEYFRDFVRGYFDGDGNVMYGLFSRRDRKNKKSILMTRFSSSSKGFLTSLQIKLKQLLGSSGSVHGFKNDWKLTYSVNDSNKLAGFMYHSNNLLYLTRKYKIYLVANNGGMGW